MSGRIRTVKPEWLEDELLGGASDEARLLSVALLLMSDDHGRGRASPATIAAGAWRYQLEADAPATLAKAARALRELVEIRFVELYEVDRQRYFAVRNWTKHQRVDKPGAPRVPAPNPRVDPPPEPPSRDIREAVASVSGTPRDNLAPDLRSGSGSPITDRESARAHEAEAEARALGYPPSLAAGLRDEIATAWRTGYVKRFERRWAVTSTGPAGQHMAKLIAKAEAQKDPLAFVRAALEGFFTDDWTDERRHPIGNLAEHAERYATTKAKPPSPLLKVVPAWEAPPAEVATPELGDAGAALLASIGLRAPTTGTP